MLKEHPSPALDETPLPERDSITGLLAQVSEGNREAEARLMDRVYSELHRLAVRFMRRERHDHTLQPSALVNELFLRLAQSPQGVPNWQNRSHFFAVAAQIMRRILVDNARARKAGKRGGVRVTFSDGIAETTDKTWEVLAIHEAMERLERLSPRQSRLVELRFFGGMSLEESALVLNISERTARRDWLVARAWLHAQLDS